VSRVSLGFAAGHNLGREKPVNADPPSSVPGPRAVISQAAVNEARVAETRPDRRRSSARCLPGCARRQVAWRSRQVFRRGFVMLRGYARDGLQVGDLG